MKSPLLFLAALSLLATGVEPLLTREAGRPPLSKPEEQVRKLEREWRDAHVPAATSRSRLSPRAGLRRG